MRYKLRFTTRAARELRKIDPSAQSHLREVIGSLRDHPRLPGVKKLQDFDYWRIRIGDIRVVYEIDDDVVTVTVVKVARRDTVYKKL